MNISTKKVKAQPVSYIPEGIEITIQDAESLYNLRCIAAKMRAKNWQITCTGFSCGEDKTVAEFLKATLGQL